MKCSFKFAYRLIFKEVSMKYAPETIFLKSQQKPKYQITVISEVIR